MIVEKIFIHRLPYMIMNQTKIWRANLLIVMITCTFAYFYNTMGILIKVASSFNSPFNLFIYPGMFYYFALKQEIRASNDDPYLKKQKS